MPRIDRQIPNPKSKILPHALVGAVGMELQANATVPPLGMGTVVLYTKASHHLCANAASIQRDLGLPWMSDVQSEATLTDVARGMVFEVNPDSEILRNAIIGGMGLGSLRPTIPPPGMWVVALYIPLAYLTSNGINAIQNDLGLPWYCEGGEPVWIDDETEMAKTAGP